MVVHLPESLRSLVSRRFLAAKESGALIFSATQLAVLRSRNNNNDDGDGVEYQLRYCPALAKKPTDKEKEKEKEKQKNEEKDKDKGKGQQQQKPDPFENPPAELVIADIPPASSSRAKGHFLILNKYPVIANHFILATRSFEPQTDLLGRDDLEVAFACLRAWRRSSSSNPSSSSREEGGGEEEGEKRLFAFFNSGVDSGASQPHRHLQFLPVEDMRPGGTSWRPLIDLLSSSSSTTTSQVTREGVHSIKHLPTLPFQHFAICLSQRREGEEDEKEISPDALHAMYLSLYRAALVAAGISDSDSDSLAAHELQRSSGPAAISYNLAMTEEVMMLCPRRKESGSLSNRENDEVSLNGTILAGTLMVKSEEQWDRIRADVELIDSLLAEVGIPYS